MQQIIYFYKYVSVLKSLVSALLTKISCSNETFLFDEVDGPTELFQTELDEVNGKVNRC